MCDNEKGREKILRKETWKNEIKKDNLAGWPGNNFA